MCSIIGALLHRQNSADINRESNRILRTIYDTATARGRDGRGFHTTVGNSLMGSVVESHDINRFSKDREVVYPEAPRTSEHIAIVGNSRAEPTTEYVQAKKESDQQPYAMGGWVIVHNGTIANDAQLREEAMSVTGLKLTTRIDSAAIVETLTALSPESPGDIEPFDTFCQAVGKLQGSYAILAKTDNASEMFVAANYRPIWYITTIGGFFFASTRDSFPEGYVPQMVQPYCAMYFRVGTAALGGTGVARRSFQEKEPLPGDKALVVCSGGLDSVVSAVYAQRKLNMEVELFHVQYGSRAEGPEVKAITEVAEWMGVNVKFMHLPVYSVSDSPLLQSDSKVAGGEEGAEFAHEWVPARNLLLLAAATAYAEAHNFKWLVLGNNLEEAGAYPDNEPEFIARFNDMLPFAVGDGKRVRVLMPVGNLMKHEIVALGHELNAPMHLTWSCYRAGVLHCGKCGPCYMRRTAFNINNFEEVITYE